MSILIALLILSVIIIIHEFGHFLLAKVNGVGVTEFAVGMGPRILQYKKGETVYCIKLLPFGGSCMMVGEDEECDDAKAFNNKSVWARISIIAAGPIFNFLLAFIMALLIIGNEGYDPCVIAKVEEGSAAYKAGLREGDQIVEIDGDRVYFSREYVLMETVSPGKALQIVYLRDGVEYTAVLTPEYIETDYYQVGISINGLTISSVVKDRPADLAGVMKDDVILAINGEKIETSEQVVSMINNSKGNSLVLTVLRGNEELNLTVTPKLVHSAGYESGISMNYTRHKAGVVDTVGLSVHEVGYWIDTVFKSLQMMIRGQVGKDDVAGPVGVVSLIGEVVEESKPDGFYYVLLNVFNLMLMLSANLGVMNLLPLPALDGGRLVFLIIEAVRRKPIDREKEGMVHFIGIILLLILMVFITFNDVLKLF
ncbi:MAG: RIP metalloprotease RseP [Lachnospiraceae bacterium]